MIFVFKCRRCGGLDKTLHRGGDSQESRLTCLVDLCNAMRDTVKECQAPRMLSLHSCGPMQTGIADLVGCEPEDFVTLPTTKQA